MWQDHLAGILGSNGDHQRRAIGGGHFIGMRDSNSVDALIHLALVDVVTVANDDILILQPAEPGLASMTNSP